MPGLGLNGADTAEKTNSLFHAEQAAPTTAFFNIGDFRDIKPLTIIANTQLELIILIFQDDDSILCLRVLDNVAYASLNYAEERDFNIGGQTSIGALGFYRYIDAKRMKPSLSVLANSRD